MSAGLLALGLLIDQSENGYQVEQRVRERLGSTGYSKGAVRNALSRLECRGEVVREGCRGGYVPTEQGVARFKRWLRSSTSLPPMREELLARIAFCGPQDMPRLIEVIREAQLASIAQLEDHNGLLVEEEARTDLKGWERHVACAVSNADAAWWDARIVWLESMRESLRDALATYEAEQRSEHATAPGRA